MKNLLIVSSTRNTNYELSSSIKIHFENKDNIKCLVVSLEEFDLPLYTPTLEENFRQDGSFPDDITKIKDILVGSDAIIWCSPEYNGGISPILTNAIAWISRTTDDWKEGFKDKHSLVCTSSGGNGHNFVKGFTLQLTYLGAEVMDRSIIKTKKKDIDGSEFEEILDQFYKKI
tara:strand:+ start:1055 stop:1573 length:519 start_codon:yes stop_codon:yes gene_type:complete